MNGGCTHPDRIRDVTLSSIDTLVELSRKLGLKTRIEVTPDPGVSFKVTKARAA